jgi:hypothetical protein
MSLRRLGLAVLLCALSASAAVAQPGDLRQATTQEILQAAQRLHPAQGARAVSGAGADRQKCGLWLGQAIRSRWDKFSDAERAELSAFLAPPLLQKTRTIGLFRVHYDTSGFNAAAMLDLNEVRVPNSADEFADSVGAVFNEVYLREVGDLGYPSPIQPGQSVYDVYVTDIGYYGYTETNGTIGASLPTRSTSFIVVENDFQFFYSSGIAGLKVTAAHEFHHAIQFAGYGYWPDEDYFMEMTSTWMEDVVYDDINDYIAYLRDPYSPTAIARGQFATPELEFTHIDQIIQYSRMIWCKYLEQRHSRDLIRRIWERTQEVPPLEAMDGALGEVGSSLRQAFLEWSAWNFRTGASADTLNGYKESASFPPMHVRAQYAYAAPSRVFPDSIMAMSSGYHIVTVDGRQMLVVISNVDRAIPPGPRRFRYEMQDAEAVSFKRLSNGISVRVTADDPEDWVSQESVPSVVADVVAYPNPFVRGRGPNVTFRLPVSPADEHATLLIFSVGLDKIYQGDVPVVQLRPLEESIQWDGTDEAGIDAPTGVYIYVIRVDGKEYTGKFTLIGG